MAITVFSVAIAGFSWLASGAIEAGAALGLFSFIGLWLGKQAFVDR